MSVVQKIDRIHSRIGRFNPIWYDIGYHVSWHLYHHLFSLRFEGTEHIPKTGPLMICPNHESYLDPIGIGLGIPRSVYYFARKSLFHHPFMAFFLPRTNTIPIDQDRPDIAGIRTALRILKEEKPLMVFPEGQRTRDGQLQPGQPGVGLLIVKSGVPVLPCRIRGSFQAMPPDSKKISRVPLLVRYGPLIPPLQLNPGEDREQGYQRISNEVMAAIAAL